MRHQGTVINTGSRVILAFLQLPDAPHKCLCIQTDTLPDYYREIINRLVQSDEGQTAVEFYTVLARHKVEGVNKDLLTVLHQAGQLLALPIDNVQMNPMPNTAIPLRQVLNALGRNVPHGQGVPPSDQFSEPKKFNQFEQNQQADLDGNRKLMAQSKLRQAQLLESDATRYRNEAYDLDPTLRPMTTVSPAPVAAPADFTEAVTTLEDIAATYSDAEPQLNLFSDDNPNA